MEPPSKTRDLPPPTSGPNLESESSFEKFSSQQSLFCSSKMCVSVSLAHMHIYVPLFIILLQVHSLMSGEKVYSVHFLV